MALQTITASAAYIPDLITSANAQLATLTNVYIRSITFQVTESPRVASNELSLVIVYESGASAHTAYQLNAVAGTTFSGAAASLQTAQDAQPTYWYGPTIATNFTESRRTNRFILAYLYNTVLADGQTYYVVGGTGATSGGGTLGGSIASTQIAVGSGANTIGGSSEFVFASGQMAIVNGVTAQSTPVSVTGSVNNFYESNIRNTSNGVTASSDSVITSDTGTSTTQYVDLGINGSGYTGGVFGAALEGYLYHIDNNLNIGSALAGGLLRLMAGGSSTGSNTIITLSTSAITATRKMTFPATATSAASITLPHGTAPTSPVNGDVWTTTSGMFCRVNGATVGPFGTGTIGGSIASTQVAVGNGTNTVAGSAAFVSTAAAPITIVPAAQSSGTPRAISVSTVSHTNLTLSTEVTGFNYTAQNKQWATGALTTQREHLIAAPTYSFVAASTITTAATVAIANAPTAGTNATITNAYALWVQSGRSQFGGQVVVDGTQVTSSVGQFSVNPTTVATSGTPTLASFVAVANTGMTASTEVIGVNFNMAATRQWATGAIATQREVVVQAPTYAFVGASTITTAATLTISGAPIAGTNATITLAHAFFVQGGRSKFNGIVDIGGSSDTTGVGQFRVAPVAAASGTPVVIMVTAPTNTGMTASAEVNGISLNMSNIRTWATGAITTQREILIQAPTYAFAAASTITDAATLAITGAPIAGTNATITRSMALWVQAGVSRFDGGVTVGSTTMITSNVAFTNGAGAGAGTMTNAPAAGNPTKWIPVNDNGTTRHIPAW